MQIVRDVSEKIGLCIDNSWQQCKWLQKKPTELNSLYTGWDRLKSEKLVYDDCKQTQCFWTFGKH